MTEPRDLDDLIRASLDERAERLPATRGRLMTVLDRVERRRNRRRRSIAAGSFAVVGLGVVGLMATGGAGPERAAENGQSTLATIDATTPAAPITPVTVDLGDELWWACTDELDREDGVTYYARCERLPRDARLVEPNRTLEELGPDDSSVAVVTNPTNPTAASSTTSTLTAGPIPLLAIGDSEMIDVETELTDRGYTVLAEEGRQMIDMVPVMAEFDERNIFDDVVVIHLGTNGPFDRETLDAFLAPLSDVPNVIILNVRVDRPWTASNNRILADRDRPGDNIILIDWQAVSEDCAGNCFGGDGIGLSADGVEFYANTIGDITGR